MEEVGRVQYVTDANLGGIDLAGALAPPLPDPVGGLILLDQDVTPRVLTGIYSGPVSVTIERRQDAPGRVQPGCDDVVEVSCRTDDESDVVVVKGPWVDAPGPEAALNVDDDWFRVRIHARNRDEARDEIVTEAREEYLFLSWPAAYADPVVLAAAFQSATSDGTVSPEQAELQRVAYERAVAATRRQQRERDQ
jgi:hypothetical protein